MDALDRLRKFFAQQRRENPPHPPTYDLFLIVENQQKEIEELKDDVMELRRKLRNFASEMGGLH